MQFWEIMLPLYKLLHRLLKSHMIDDYGRRASGLLSQLEIFDTFYQLESIHIFFGLKLSYLVFSGTE